MKFPKIDLRELKKQQKRNLEDRLDFVRLYAEWVKKTPNKEWSAQQKKIIDRK